MAFSNNSLTVLRGTPERLAKRTAQYLQDRTKAAAAPVPLNAPPDVLQAARAKRDQALEDLRVKFTGDLATERADLAGTHRNAMVAIDRGMGRPAPANTNEALLRETQELRAWNRVKPILDNAEASYSGLRERLQTVVSTAAANGDDHTIHALRTELPGYLAGRQAEPGDVRPLTDALDQAIVKAKPELADVVAARSEVAAGVPRIETGIGQLMEFVGNRGETSALVPGWGKGSMWHVSEAGAQEQTGPGK